jgi:SAM-dependent methyltransferase
MFTSKASSSSHVDIDSKSSPLNQWGSFYYTSIVLQLYDFWVLNLSNTFAWQCSTKKVLVPFFNTIFSYHHLDVGVGTGFFPAFALDTKGEKSYNHDGSSRSARALTLVDLNPNSLSAAARRIQRPNLNLRCVQADALAPLPLLSELGVREKFDSVSLFFLLHCLPGPCVRKTKIFSILAPHLTENGVLAGATILGQGVEHNLFGKLLIWLYNRLGVFDNYGDNGEEIIRALKSNFELVESQILGCVLRFRASRPRH